jgi:hypothetical protein
LDAATIYGDARKTVNEIRSTLDICESQKKSSGTPSSSFERLLSLGDDEKTVSHGVYGKTSGRVGRFFHNLNEA